MKSWKVFALALAVAGMLVADAEAGGRRGRRVRGCSEGSCATTTTCGTASSCSTGSCGQVVESKPATKVEDKATTTTPVTTGTVIYSGTCRGGRCR